MITPNKQREIVYRFLFFFYLGFVACLLGGRVELSRSEQIKGNKTKQKVIVILGDLMLKRKRFKYYNVN